MFIISRFQMQQKEMIDLTLTRSFGPILCPSYSMSELAAIMRKEYRWKQHKQENCFQFIHMRDVVISLLGLKLHLCVPFCLTTLFPAFFVFLVFPAPHIINIFYCCLVQLLPQTHWECFMDSLLVLKAVCCPVRDCRLIPSPNRS